MNINLTLTLEQVNVILNTLGEAPFKVSEPVITTIRTQAMPQLEEAPAPETVTEDDTAE